MGYYLIKRKDKKQRQLGSIMPSLLKKYFIFTVIAGIVASVAPGAEAAKTGEELIGVPWHGEKSVGKTVEEIMAGTNIYPMRGPKKQIVLPFRTNSARKNNKQNPASQQETTEQPLLDKTLLSSSYLSPLTAQTLDLGFTGATLADTNSFPPDTMGAAGPTQYIVAINGRIRSFDKSTGIADGVLNTDMDIFFSSVMTPTTGTFTSDPHIRYDRLSGRWIVIIIDVPGGTGAGPNRVLLAVSNSGTITNSTLWTFFHFQGDTTYFADYPTLGVDANALYIGVNLFDAAGQFQNSSAFVVNKSSLLSGSLVVTAFGNLIGGTTGSGPFTPQGADNYDPAATEGYFIGVDNASFGTLMLRRVSNPGVTPTMSGNISITVPTTSFPLSVPNLGGTKNLDALDDRLFAGHMRNGFLWTAHNIGVDNTGAASTKKATRDGSRWYQLQGIASPGTPSVVQSGTVFDPTFVRSPLNYWIPSIMVSGQGHVAMGFSVAGAHAYANAGTTGRLSGDPTGTMQTPVLFTASSTAYNPRGDTGSPRRWGDYSYTSLDPNDDMTMWTIQEFCDSTNSYGVRVVRLLAPPPATLSSASPASVPLGQTSVNVTITGTQTSGSGFFDPGSGFPQRLSVSVSGGVAVNSVLYTDPAHITLTISTVGSSPGAQNVTVTNPDGQSSTGTGILTIGAAAISISPTSENFGNVNVGTSSTQIFTISNTGTVALTVSSTSLSGGDSAMFSMTPGTCPSLTPTINAGQSCTINVTFAPTSTGTESATLVITSNAYNSPTLNVGLSGTGVSILTVAGAAAGSTGTVTGGSSINCSIASDGTTSGICSETDSVNALVLTASPASGASTIWSGCTTSSGNTCNVTLNAHITVTAAFSLFPVKRVEGGATVAYYSTIQEAFNAALSGDIIEMQATTFTENPNFNNSGVLVLLKGGFDSTFGSQVGKTTIQGTLTISAGTATVQNLIIN
jgi:hypothetical protein